MKTFVLLNNTTLTWLKGFRAEEPLWTRDAREAAIYNKTTAQELQKELSRKEISVDLVPHG